MNVKQRTQSVLVVVLLMLASWSRASVSLTLAADSVPASSSTDTRLSLDEWTYIRVDDSRGKWGDTDEPKWLRYFGLATCDLTGDGMKDIVSGRYFYRNPGGNMTGSWQRVDLGRNVDAILALDVADVDADGSLDIVAGNGEKYVAWWRNPATGEANWQRYIIGTTAPHPADRLKARDMNGDGKIDVVVTEERYPGKEPDANLWWFEQPADPKSESWTPHRIVTEYSLNNLDLADFDRDGDFSCCTIKTICIQIGFTRCSRT